MIADAGGVEYEQVAFLFPTFVFQGSHVDRGGCPVGIEGESLRHIGHAGYRFDPRTFCCGIVTGNQRAYAEDCG